MAGPGFSDESGGGSRLWELGDMYPSCRLLSAVILFNSGASYSFISSSFLEHIGVESKPLLWRMHIHTGNGLVEVSRICSCPLVVSGRHFLARLIEFSMKNFDAVQDMDWVSARHATIECHEG